MKSVDEPAHSRHDIHRDQVFEGLSGGRREGGAQTHKVDQHSEHKLCSEGGHSLSLTINYQKVVEHYQRNDHVQEEIDQSQDGQAVETSVQG